MDKAILVVLIVLFSLIRFFLGILWYCVDWTWILADYIVRRLKSEKSANHNQTLVARESTRFKQGNVYTCSGLSPTRSAGFQHQLKPWEPRGRPKLFPPGSHFSVIKQIDIPNCLKKKHVWIGLPGIENLTEERAIALTEARGQFYENRAIRPANTVFEGPFYLENIDNCPLGTNLWVSHKTVEAFQCVYDIGSGNWTAHRLGKRWAVFQEGSFHFVRKCLKYD